MGPVYLIPENLSLGHPICAKRVVMRHLLCHIMGPRLADRFVITVNYYKKKTHTHCTWLQPYALKPTTKWQHS